MITPKRSAVIDRVVAWRLDGHAFDDNTLAAMYDLAIYRLIESMTDEELLEVMHRVRERLREQKSH